MSDVPMLELKDKVLACHRRLFDADEPRFFAGEVTAFNGAVVKLRGYSFVRDLNTGSLLRKPDERIKLISVIAGTHLLYQLPAAVVIQSLHFKLDEGLLVLADGAGFEMDLTERPRAGRI